MDDQVFSYQTNPEHEKEMHKILELRGKLLAMQQTTKPTRTYSCCSSGSKHLECN
jgi:hypothetical protein